MATSFHYTPFYCEENIWQLAADKPFQQAQVVLITGKSRYRRLWFQRSAATPQAPVYWDYHVILLAHAHGWQVWDPDTALGLPVAAKSYFDKTFFNAKAGEDRTDVVLRLIPAEYYVANLSSDRSHMRLPNGEWSAPPPAWPMIQRDGRPNLLDWLNIERAEPGRLLTLAEWFHEYCEEQS